MPGEEWMECALRIVALPLIPELQSDLLVFQLDNFEREVAIGSIELIMHWVALEVVVHEGLDE
eukprot:CAMPEP_0170500728 /NCGR_PEP_ID=MMETSP0208-20121228/35860_1 /TAXON_ID=197538 /ORGANISM="Strombidium inclinatum, Strain S3" /LENGTH=62 /DNA_ID=CAMNT_0010778899 /DNA_START=461 /DNA_END=649 /DNA_ORIENTATION=+